MTTRLRKTRKHRGQISHGKGRVGKHRKHSSGRGNAGGQHHHRINMDKFHPGYFGKVGQRHFHWKKNPRFCPTTNVEVLASMAKPAEGDKLPVVNLVQRGIFKVLGKGGLNKPIIVRTRSISRIAQQKIFAAGGGVELVK
eukprot:NODE_8095_length_565_cov_289.303653_g8072_i0.p1 GENE.NODE_8095_length_565_cov_289.303653_g8072_i0~~NODE_8095_length_565_cov_289.303653_g8072_i0.p1  ORF type:complete len:140 (+),score=17.29 NODE_8095_length_565_cov_289.303653_g8072_i0:68-487(+)